MARSLSIAALVLSGCIAPASLAFAEVPTFSIDEAADAVIVEVVSTGGLRGGGARYLLFGDGRVEYASFDHLGEPRSAAQAELSIEELQQLIEGVVASGAPHLGTEGLEASVEAALQRRGVAPLEADGPAVRISVHFRAYADPGERPRERTVTLRGQGLDTLARFLPEVEALRAMVEVHSTLQARVRESERARESPRNQ